MSETATTEVQEWADPDLGVEFCHTLLTFWRSHRADYTTEALPVDQPLYMFLDSATSVVLGSDEED